MLLILLSISLKNVYTAHNKLYLCLVHPCDIGNGGCGQICEKDGDSTVCACEEGFELGPDGKSCSASKYKYQ